MLLCPPKRMVARIGVLLPIIVLASCVAFIYMSFGDLGIEVMETQMGFVGRNGTQFVSGGSPFYVNGWNSYWLMDQAVEEFTRERVSRMFQIGRKMRLTVCRTWAFNDGAYHALQISPGRFDENVFKALDWVIWESRRNGIRLLLSLSNDLNAYGGKAQYVKWAWEDGSGLSSSVDSFFSDPSIRGYFKNYIKTILTRKNHLTGLEYREDPTIFAWELMNEPHCSSDPTGDTFQKWLEEMVGLIKSLDDKHLVTVGLEGFYGPTSPREKLILNPSDLANKLGLDFIRNFNIVGMDFASVHVYPDHWFTNKYLTLDEKVKFASEWVASHIEDGDQQLKKPVLFSEFGLSNRSKNFDPSQREVFYAAIYNIIHESARNNRAGAGSLIWQLMVEGMDEYLDDFAVFPEKSASTYALIGKQSCRLDSMHHHRDLSSDGLDPVC